MPQNADGSAVLCVVVTTALGALPLADAAVSVSSAADESGERTLLYAVRTGPDGMTPPMELATPPRAGSLTPGGSRPFSVYTVEVAREGYTPVAALHVAMFSGVPAVLPVAMTPLAENEPLGETGLTATGDPQALYQSEPFREE